MMSKTVFDVKMSDLLGRNAAPPQAWFLAGKFPEISAQETPPKKLRPVCRQSRRQNRIKNGWTPAAVSICSQTRSNLCYYSGNNSFATLHCICCIGGFPESQHQWYTNCFECKWFMLGDNTNLHIE